MKILLVQTWLGREQHPVLPVGLASIAGSLSEHEVRIEDLNLSGSPMERLRSVLADHKPDAVGFSLRNADTTSYFDRYSYIPRCLEQIELTSRLCPNAHILAGGAGFSIFAEQIMGHSPHIHCGVKGHGELIAPELVRNRAYGLYPGAKGEFISPRFDLLSLSSYIPFEKNIAVGVEVNRGCDRRCTYCSYPAISGKSVQERPLEQIREDMVHLIGQGSKHFFLIASVLNNRRARGMEVASMVGSLNSGITWEAYHSALDFDGEYASFIRNSGCLAVSFSPDGGTAEQMRRIGKDYNTADLESAITAAVTNGIQVSLNIFPWGTAGGISEMIQAFRNGARWGRLAGEVLMRLRFSLIRKLPGTPFTPAEVSLNGRIPVKEFIKPSSPGMVAFRVMKSMYERDMIKA
ncbi:MAG: cobalamin-dependent protein [Candidatus Aegiribacteria sp.]|nr:cobalamin-dependent protein [Candidatus Aegiribacteria sp.]